MHLLVVDVQGDSGEKSGHVASPFAGAAGIWKKKHLCTEDGSEKSC